MVVEGDSKGEKENKLTEIFSSWTVKNKTKPKR